MNRPRRSWAGFLMVLAAVVATTAGCAPPAPSTAPVIAYLLPDAETPRWELLDRPLFERFLADNGDYRVISANAGGSATRQLEQAESALAAGASVLVVNPVDQAAGRAIVDTARALDVPVISYDRLIDGGGAAFYVSFDNERVGTLQAEGLVAGMREKGTLGDGILVIAGDPNDANTTDLNAGSSRVLEAAGAPVLARYDVPGWSAGRAQEWAATQVSQFGDRVAGVYAGNDGLAGAAIAAFRSAGITSTPVVTGQDADLSAIRRIVDGTQYATVFKDIAEQARIAAEAAAALATGTSPSATSVVGGVPAIVLEPELVTVDDIQRVIIEGGLYSVEEVCLPDLIVECEAAGISVGRVSSRLGG